MSQVPNAAQGRTLGRTIAATRLVHNPAATPGQNEAEALASVEAHQERILAAARLAFQRPPDPLRTFAETVASTGVVQVRAMLLLNHALNERVKFTLADLPGPSDGQDRVIPAGDLLSLLGIYPTDKLRFRLWAIGATGVIILAVLGAGVIIGRSSVHNSAPMTTTAS